MSMKKKTSPIDAIQEREEMDSETNERKEETDSDEDEEELGRSKEVIDLDHVSVASSSAKSTSKKQKAILSEEEVRKIERDAQLEREAVEARQNSIKLNMKTQSGLKEALKFQMRIFDMHYDFAQDLLVGGESMYLGPPSLEELYYYCKYVIISGRMEKEIPILCLIYLERFFTKTGILMNFANWKRLTLISLILASKIWDDDSLENVHFP